MDAPVMRVVAEKNGAVLTLTLDYPARRNALAMPLRKEIEEALEAASVDGTRAVVITGAGGHFCSGGDISGMDARGMMAGRDRMRRTHRFIQTLAFGNFPVVAAVEGYCVGAGLSLACISDTVIASETAKLGAGFGKIGLMADLGLPFTLPQRIGVAKARQVLLYHKQFTAAEALAIDLVDEVVPAGQALAVAQERAAFLAEQAPTPMALTRQMLAQGLHDALETERHFQAALFATEDFNEGREAFLGKRAPAFKGV
ncbi:enoyl-CoA hydratase/isomerase family protein [Rhodovarius crocodyli]|uniref:Enoyl-CoA hydratase/isomerase family protein n=1 Tax=Rhodovarius crocodyli TaxID=1979269 RepID=A0A437MGQ8_9PROT|nr:enoyl-CoA hydratase-related protein [Rhodovarius crocodyli]RVT96817.1 enoyl-CoA hydratase/isomerase family protein [Rhodovarius crocodyli]